MKSNSKSNTVSLYFFQNVDFWAYADASFSERHWTHKLTDPDPDPEQCWIASNYGYLFCQILFLFIYQLSISIKRLSFGWQMWCLRKGLPVFAEPVPGPPGATRRGPPVLSPLPAGTGWPRKYPWTKSETIFALIFIRYLAKFREIFGKPRQVWHFRKTEWLC